MYKVLQLLFLFCFPFFVLLDQSLFPIFNLRYAQLLFTLRGRSCADGGGFKAHEESVQGDGGGG